MLKLFMALLSHFQIKNSIQTLYLYLWKKSRA